MSQRQRSALEEADAFEPLADPNVTVRCPLDWLVRTMVPEENKR